MLEHRAAEGKRRPLRSLGLGPGGALNPGHLGPKHLEAAAQQAFLACVVGVEGGAADIGLIDDVLHGDAFIALAQDQRHERVVQRPARADGAAVHRVCHLQASDIFPD